MLWFRSHLGCGSRLALFALAVQLVLSFGHVHTEDLVPPAATVVAAARGQSATALPNAPSPVHQSDGSTDGICAICALIQLVSVSVPAEAPPLAVPVSLARIWPDTPSDSSSTVLPRRCFQARAPPSA